MADQETPAPDEQTAEASVETSPEAAPAQPEATPAQPEAAQEPPAPEEAQAEPAPVERVSVDKGGAPPESVSANEQGPVPDEFYEPPDVIITEPDEEVQEYNEEEEIKSGDRQEDYEDEMTNALDVDQDSLDALVKSSSIQIAKGRSLEADRSSSLVAIDKIDKYAGKAKEVLGEVIDIRKSSITGEAGDRRTARFMNTYKLDSDNPFNSQNVDKILMSVMEEAFRDLKYEPEKCCKEAKWASNTIKEKVKQMEFDRYKIISLVSIGEKHNQDVLCTCRFLWDADRDNYSCYTLENPYIFAIALCFGLYYE